MSVKIEVITEIEGREDSTGASAMEMESLKVIDHDNSSDRKWLSSHLFWAMRNGRTVTIQPVTR